MKKIRRTDLKLEKEVISRLSDNELTVVKGGTDKSVNLACGEIETNACIIPVKTFVESKCDTCFTNGNDSCRVCMTQTEYQSCRPNYCPVNSLKCELIPFSQIPKDCNIGFTIKY